MLLVLECVDLTDEYVVLQQQMRHGNHVLDCTKNPFNWRMNWTFPSLNVGNPCFDVGL